MNRQQPLPNGTRVRFDIAQGHAVGAGAITGGDFDEGWLYRIEVEEGDGADMHRNTGGELWVCDFELEPA